MLPVPWKLMSAVLIVGGTAGALCGQAVTAGMVSPAPVTASLQSERRASDPSSLGSPVYGPDDYAEANPAAASYARIADECDGCSDYDLGYRFAASRNLQTTMDCMEYSWSYQRGCLAYLREG